VTQYPVDPLKSDALRTPVPIPCPLTLVLSAAVARADHRHRRNRPADFAVGHRHGARDYRKASGITISGTTSPACWSPAVHTRRSSRSGYGTPRPHHAGDLQLPVAGLDESTRAAVGQCSRLVHCADW